MTKAQVPTRAAANAGNPTPQASGRDVLTFAEQAGVSRTTIYALLPQFQPRSVMIGKRRVYTEAPADWLARITEAGGATTRQQHPSSSRKRRAS